MKTLFITAGDETFASSRIRAYWPAKYMEDTEVIPAAKLNGISSDVETIILQKVVLQPEVIDALMLAGVRVFWDVCDPVWWFSPKDANEVILRVSGMVCSNQGLANDLKNWCEDWKQYIPIHTIPDRIEEKAYPLKRQHHDVDPVRFIWFGFSQNRPALYGALANLERLQANGHNISLTVFDDNPPNSWRLPVSFPVHYETWSLDKENEVIAGHDIALLPPYPGPWGSVKSDNKQLTAWACNLPVVNGFVYEDIIPCMDAKLRDLWGMDRVFTAKESPALSAREWEALCASS